MSESSNSQSRPRHSATRIVFVRDLTLDAYIGVYDHEQGVAQPVRIDIDVEVEATGEPFIDSLDSVMCYNKLTRSVKNILADGHIKLVETLAEKIASIALIHPLAVSVRVRIEKPHALPEAAAAGVEVFRSKKQ